MRWHIAAPRYGSCYPICEHRIEENPSGKEQFANARLIAAAPELLDIVYSYRQMFSEGRISENLGTLDLLGRANASIAKAEGYMDKE